MIGRLLVIVLALFCTSDGRAADRLNWTELPPLPDPIGFAGPYAGVAGDALIVAGGANFPEAAPWEGGTKVWYRDAFVLDAPDGKWRRVADALPRPLGYGGSVTIADGLLCLGGSDAARHYSDVFLLRWDGKRIEVDPFPSLPQPVAHPTALLLGDAVYVAGGLESADAAKPLKTFWRLDLSAPAKERRWEELPPWPGRPRFLANAGVLNGAIYLAGGVDLVAGAEGTPLREYLRDAYCYRPAEGWSRLADLPMPLAASPGPAIPLGNSQLLFPGGDTGEHATRVAELQDRHPGFSRALLAYDAASDTWATRAELPVPTAVTTWVVNWRGRFVIPTGEIRPGVRTPTVNAATLRKTTSDD